MKRVLVVFRNFISERFNLHDDSAQNDEIIDSIRRNIEFKGSNLWSLIFAIFIASIGLNVNSTAVIIGAMLISPLMGPIMGVGLGMGINDIELIRRAAKNLLIAVIISVAVSAFYFVVTPLHDAQSELLARTTPSIWDVFIALFGGLAGIVGGTRREKSNVIPGVAIATALMPPLCTAGFGLAIGNWYYFLGAFYLFFINSVFICISTYLISRYLKLPKKAFEDKGREKKVMRYILTVVMLTALPSVYLAYKIVDKSIFESNANRFVKNEFHFKTTHIIKKSFQYEKGKKTIDLLLLGEDLPKDTIEALTARLANYNIADSRLSVSQGLNAKQQIDLSQIKAGILEDLFSKQRNERNAVLTKAAQDGYNKFPEIGSELKALYPSIRAYSLTKAVSRSVDTAQSDTVVLFVGDAYKDINRNDKRKLTNWIKSRTQADSVALLIRIVPKVSGIRRN